MSGVQWIKSSYSANNGNCVEVAFSTTKVLTRDSKNPSAPHLEFPAASWRALVRGL
ncbi:DUF397 domain-containing protein [Actinosynnema sp. NPDC020468]|uniref:DUF397 domain-containing protein n=1 Tax=Actinosynnema sp. NPDC020468 TaxID=3154488 RepID=UPI0033ED851B